MAATNLAGEPQAWSVTVGQELNSEQWLNRLHLNRAQLVDAK
jgi:hypothetical protein